MLQRSICGLLLRLRSYSDEWYRADVALLSAGFVANRIRKVLVCTCLGLGRRGVLRGARFRSTGRSTDVFVVDDGGFPLLAQEDVCFFRQID